MADSRNSSAPATSEMLPSPCCWFSVLIDSLTLAAVASFSPASEGCATTYDRATAFQLLFVVMLNLLMSDFIASLMDSSSFVLYFGTRRSLISCVGMPAAPFGSPVNAAAHWENMV